MKRVSLFILSSLFVVLLGSCKKDNKTEDECTISQTSLAGTYLITSATEQVDGGAAEPAERKDCELDDEYTFNADGTGSTADGAVKCDPSSDETGGSWSYANNKIVLGANLEPEDRDTFDVVSFDCKVLTISRSDTADDGSTYKEVTVFTRK